MAEIIRGNDYLRIAGYGMLIEPVSTMKPHIEIEPTVEIQTTVKCYEPVSVVGHGVRFSNTSRWGLRLVEHEVLVPSRRTRFRAIDVSGTFHNSGFQNLSGADSVRVNAVFTDTDGGGMRNYPSGNEQCRGYTHMRSGDSDIRLIFQHGIPRWKAKLNHGVQKISCSSHRLGYQADGSPGLDRSIRGQWLQGKVDAGGENARYIIDVTDDDSLPREHPLNGYEYGVALEASPGPTVFARVNIDAPHWSPRLDTSYIEQPNNPNLKNHSHVVSGRMNRVTVGGGCVLRNLTANQVWIQPPAEGEEFMPVRTEVRTVGVADWRGTLSDGTEISGSRELRNAGLIELV